MKKFLPALLLVTLITFACSGDDDAAAPCDQSLNLPGLVVRVTNATTGMPVTDINVTAEDGTYAEELVLVPQTFEFWGARERSGTYIIDVTGEGYQSYQSQPIEVIDDGCHVLSEVLNVTLVPLPE